VAVSVPPFSSLFYLHKNLNILLYTRLILHFIVALFLIVAQELLLNNLIMLIFIKIALCIVITAIIFVIMHFLLKAKED
jgi:hypothetical protein